MSVSSLDSKSSSTGSASSSEESMTELQYSTQLLADTVKEMRLSHRKLTAKMRSYTVEDSDVLIFAEEAIRCSQILESEKLTTWAAQGENDPKDISLDLTDSMREEAEGVMHQLDEAYVRVMEDERSYHIVGRPSSQEIRETWNEDGEIGKLIAFIRARAEEQIAAEWEREATENIDRATAETESQ